MLEEDARLKARGENQLLEVRLIAQDREVRVVLRANAEVRLQLKRAPQGFERVLDRTQTSARRRQPVMHVRRIGLTFQSALEQFLRGDEFTAIRSSRLEGMLSLHQDLIAPW